MKVFVILALIGLASAAPQYTPSYGFGYPRAYPGGYYGSYPGVYDGVYGGYPAGGIYGAYNQGGSQLGAVQGSNLNAYGAQGSQGSALQAANAQGSQGSAAQYGGLAARNAGASSSGGQKFGSAQTYGGSWGDANSYDNSIAALHGSAAQGSQGSANQLATAQGFQGSVNALNANQYGALNAANAQQSGAGGAFLARMHPLESLTEAEINATSRIIKSYRNGNFMFNYISLKEPPKSVLLQSFLSDSAPPAYVPRRSITILLDRSTNQAYEVTVNLDTRRVESWNQAPSDAIPSFTPEELTLSESIARNDLRVAERCKKLGWSNMNLVNADPWSMGYIGDRPEYKGKRLIQLYLYGKNFQEDNQYTHPFDFLVVVDLLAKKVIDFEDLPTHDNFDATIKEGNTVPKAESNYDPALRPANSFRKDLRPIKVTQPGTSFSITGNEISWQKYKFRVGFNGREGLVLYNLNYRESDKARPLFYRMSLAEMFIPYGDPRSPYHRKHVFDEGQYGVGFNTNSLREGVDCIGEVKYIDAVLHNENGDAQKIPRVVCVREVDDGILWKHTDFRTGKNALVRNQKLALTFSATIGNYDYIYTWSFSMDGAIEFNVKLTGSLSVNLLATSSTPMGHGSVVFPQINAQYHQHFFSLRLDSEIDGNQNSVTVSDVVPGPGKTGSENNPYGQGWTTERKVLKTAGEARTSVAPEKRRTWLIRNKGSIHPYTKQPVAWKLMPFPTPPMLLQKDSPIHPQAEWMDFNTWVIPYKEDQLFPGGYYLNNSGLPEWVRADENANIENTDIVIFHNFGLNHVPCAEDFPVMSHEQCSIYLKPFNFFKENPSLDVPPPIVRRAEL